MSIVSPITGTITSPITSPIFSAGGGWVTPTDIPAAEAAALKTLYEAGGGDSWTNNTGWGTGDAADYFGVTVSGGHVTAIELQFNNGSGDISAFDPSVFGSLTILGLYNNSFTGDLSGLTMPPGMVDLFLHNNSFTGDLSGWTMPSGMIRLFLDNNSFTGDLSGWTMPSGMISLYLNNNSFTGAPDMTSMVSIRNYTAFNNGMSQAVVDVAIDTLYAAAPNWTYTGGITINVGGTNAAPSGTYQAASPPTTAKEKIYDMVVDPSGKFNPITVTYTA